MCKSQGKQLGHYLENAATKCFSNALSASIGIPIDALMCTLSNVPNAQRGTWVHPQIAIHLAQWCSSACAVWASIHLSVRRPGRMSFSWNAQITGELIQHASRRTVPAQHKADGYVNATAMCKAEGKQFSNYSQNAATKACGDELSRSTGIPADSRLLTLSNAPYEYKSTLILSLLAMGLVQCRSADLAIGDHRNPIEPHANHPGGLAPLRHSCGETARKAEGPIRTEWGIQRRL